MSASLRQRWLGSLLCLALATSSGLAAAKTHRVTAGDSLWSLAKEYSVSIESIKAANKLKSDKIRTGQTLRIPSPKKAGKQRVTSKTSKSSKRAAAKSDSKAKTNSKARTQSKTKTPAKKTLAEKNPAKKTLAKKTSPRKTQPTAKKPTAKKPTSKQRVKKSNVPTPTVKAKPGRVYAHVSGKALKKAEKLYSKNSRVPSPDSLAERPPSWVLQRPSQASQGEKSNAARGGFFPCAAPDKGFGSYERWAQVAPMAHLLAPSSPQLRENGEFNVMFHFHGREPLRKEWVQVVNNTVLVSVDVGIDSGSYSNAFSDPRTFRQVVRAVEAEMARRAEAPTAVASRIGLSAWSAGYGALEQILDQPFGNQAVDSIVLLDGLHAGYTETSLDGERLRPFTRFASAAAHGQKFMFVSHSSIRTEGYASTTETAQYLVWKVGGRPKAVDANRSDPWGLERISMYSQGNFHVRGFRGSGTADHCAHLGLMQDVLRVHLVRRWSQPPAAPSQPNAREAIAWASPLHAPAAGDAEAEE